MAGFRIEKLSTDYAQSVFEMENENLGTGDIESILKTIDNKNLNYYVLLSEGAVVGFFECLILPPEIELYDIVVSKEFQGKGYSKIMMDFLLELAKENNVETILLEVNKMNNRAINLYLKYGFKEYAVREKYYGENDAILMRLELN